MGQIVGEASYMASTGEKEMPRILSQRCRTTVAIDTR
jgi:hypothetical protein